MSDDLLRHYNSELEFLRKSGAQFAKAHPQTAGLLNFDSQADYDPHVARLIQAFAYLNARTRQKLEDDFPEIAGAMLEVLYPHYLRPLPSMAIVQMQLEPHQIEFFTGYQVPRHTMLVTPPIAGDSCRFRTSWDVRCWPLRITHAHLKGVPFTAPKTSFSQAASSLLTLGLETFAPDIPLKQLSLDKLRLYLDAPLYFAFELYELLNNNVLGIAATEKLSDLPKVLPNDALTPAGFALNEGMFDYPPQSFLGYRLLTEFFAFPEKFMFIDLDLSGILPKCETSKVELFVYFDQHREALEPHISDATFRTGCTPIINLYSQRAEPLRLDHQRTEYRVVPDARRPQHHEIYSIDRVVGTSLQGQEVDFVPFYSVRHDEGHNVQRHFWHAMRHDVTSIDPNESGGTEMMISFVDLDFAAPHFEQLAVDIETTCFNRNLPGRLPFGGDQPSFSFEAGSAVRQVRCLTKPTNTLRPRLRHGTRWQLISHLSLNHLSLAGPQGLEAFREILRLYDFRDSPQTRKLIVGLAGITARPTVGRVTQGGVSGLCRGVEITLDFDEEQFSEGGLFLMASILDRFLGLYVTINSFTRTVVRSNKRDGVLRTWPPRAGQQILV